MAVFSPKDDRSADGPAVVVLRVWDQKGFTNLAIHLHEQDG